MAEAESRKRTHEEAEEKAARKAARKAEKKAARKALKQEAKEAAAAASAKEALLRFSAFSETPFEPAVTKALEASFAAPTDIQAQAWPAALTGRDLIAVAKTGSGKTLAFVLPVLHGLSTASSPARSVRGLVLSPTRELASQIHVEAERFANLYKLPTMVVYGGTPLREQKAALASTAPALLVGTPGRLVDLVEQGAVVLSACSAIVLDEADRLLDMGFKPQLEATYKALPSVRQTLLFSATWPKARFIQATDDEKDNKLWSLLSELAEGSRVIVFANTKRRVDNLAKTFSDFGTCSIHGDKAQRDREAALRGFVNNQTPLMVATDVAARGLDIKLVTHVINYDMARDVESYVHRIGRTGRAGATGASVTFWNPDYDKECAPALVKIAKRAGQAVPDWLLKYESTKANKLWAVAKAEKEASELLLGGAEVP